MGLQATTCGKTRQRLLPAAFSLKANYFWQAPTMAEEKKKRPLGEGRGIAVASIASQNGILSQPATMATHAGDAVQTTSPRSAMRQRCTECSASSSAYKKVSKLTDTDGKQLHECERGDLVYKVKCVGGTH